MNVSFYHFLIIFSYLYCRRDIILREFLFLTFIFSSCLVSSSFSFRQHRAATRHVRTRLAFHSPTAVFLRVLVLLHPAADGGSALVVLCDHDLQRQAEAFPSVSFLPCSAASCCVVSCGKEEGIRQCFLFLERSLCVVLCYCCCCCCCVVVVVVVVVVCQGASISQCFTFLERSLCVMLCWCCCVGVIVVVVFVLCIKEE